jgi:hypothetical protein
MLSGRAVDDDDPLSRRDEGLEFLDVTQRLRADRIDRDQSGDTTSDVYRFTNSSDSNIDTHLLIVIGGLPAKVRLRNASGTTSNGDPYIRVFLPDGALESGGRITQRFVFSNVSRSKLTYGITLLSGQGIP